MRKSDPEHGSMETQPSVPSFRRCQVLLGSAVTAVLCAAATLAWRSTTESQASSAGERPRGLQESLALDDTALGRLDPIELDLAVARTIPGCEALVLATVIGQDFGAGYHVESIAFDDPRDLFIHGVIDGRRGACVSLPVLYMAIGHRLGICYSWWKDECARGNLYSQRVSTLALMLVVELKGVRG